jgi:hypothetical protein
MKICTSCKKLDFSILDHPERIKSKHGKRLVRLPPVLKWNDRTCELCFLLRALHLKQAADGCDEPIHGYSLCAYSYQKASEAQGHVSTIARSRDAVILGLVRNPIQNHRPPGGALSAAFLAPSSLFASRNSASPLNRLNTHANFELMRSWVASCGQIHGEHVPSGGFVSEELDFLRVIDCDSRRIVHGDPGCGYVALSYVWGCGEAPYTPSDNPDLDPALLPETLPNVIEDAIQVVKALSLRYLWVDRYCIRQNDAFDKHNQIAKMDLVFKMAGLTIIAAAGSSPDHGLPGVGSNLRHPQVSGNLAKRMMLLIPSHPSEQVRKSHWMTRGWVYQEAIFSRRRLIFTQEEVYFECDAMTNRESINIGRHKLNCTTKVGLSRVQSFPELNGAPHDVLDHIAEYSKRDLSYPRDVLSAIMGIFRSYETVFGRENITYHWGLPLLLRKSVSDDMKLPWTAKLLYALSWAHAAPSRRRTGFPTWTWAGWFGGIHFVDSLKTFEPDPAIRVSVQTKQTATFQDFDEFMSQSIASSLVSPCLIIDSWTIRLKFEHLEAGDFAPGSGRKSGLYAGSKSDRKFQLYAPLLLDEEADENSQLWKRLHGKEWESIVLFYDDAHWYELMRYVLLVCEWDGDTARRIGIIDLKISPCHEENFKNVQEEFKRTWRSGIRLE